MPYFDYNSTTPLSAVAREAWLRAQDEAWQNASSLHRKGAQVKIRLDAVRERLADYLEAEQKRLVFTSGATEGARSVFAYWARKASADAVIAISPTEHPAVLENARQFFGARLRWLEVERGGQISIRHLGTLIAEGKLAGVVVMAANNETGVLQPWREIAAMCTAARVEYLCDASQWLGKLPASGLGLADWVIGSAHKFGGPKGVGLLLRAKRAEDFTSQLGGSQEHGFRAGTEDFPGVAAMSAALIEAESTKVFMESARCGERADFERKILLAVPGTCVMGAGAERLWNTVMLAMPAGENHRWVTKLDKLGVQVSTGAACSTGKQGASHVLQAMGVSAEVAQRVIRISAGWQTTPADWQEVLVALPKVATELVGVSGN